MVRRWRWRSDDGHCCSRSTEQLHLDGVFCECIGGSAVCLEDGFDRARLSCRHLRQHFLLALHGMFDGSTGGLGHLARQGLQALLLGRLHRLRQGMQLLKVGTVGLGLGQRQGQCLGVLLLALGDLAGQSSLSRFCALRCGEVGLLCRRGAHTLELEGMGSLDGFLGCTRFGAFELLQHQRLLRLSMQLLLVQCGCEGLLLGQSALLRCLALSVDCVRACDEFQSLLFLARLVRALLFFLGCQHGRELLRLCLDDVECVCV